MTLSFFISGLGQIYAGQTQRGLGILLGAVALALILPDNFLFVILLYSLWNIYDAYKSVKKYNDKKNSLNIESEWNSSIN